MKQLVHFIWLILLSQQAFSQTITWTGATDTDWATGTNWSTNVAPTAADNVFVPGSLARYPVLNSSTSIKSLAVQSGSLLTINASHTLTISGAGVGYSIDLYGTIENNGTIAVTATSDAVYLNGNAKLNNNTGATLSVTTTGNYGVKINNSGVFTNQTGATATITGNSGSLFLYGANTPVEMVKNYGRMNLTKQIEKYSDTFHNYPCGVVILTSGDVFNSGGQILNEGFFSVLGAPDLLANLNGPAADFINNGIIYVVNPNPSYTNNAIRIFNNATTTSIFEFAAGNNLTVEGIYKNDAASASAGGFNQGTNTFTPVGVPGGVQTLYAKITRPSGTCPQVVPFIIDLPGFLTQPSVQSICPGENAVFSVTSTGITSYQWQESADAAFTSPTNISTGGIYTVSSTTDASSLTVAHNVSANGKYYRCVGSPGAIASNGAQLTVIAGSSATIAYTGSPYLNVGTASVTFTGTTGGMFSAAPSGLSLNPTSGEINLATSTLGSYTVTYRVASSGGCPDFVTTTTVAIRTTGRTYVWTGATDNQWNNVNNWLVDGNIPSVLPKFGSSQGNPVQIPVVGSGRYPEVTTAEGARKITIAANASLTIKNTGNLQIVGSDTDGVTSAGTFTNNGTVLIDSSYNDGFVNQTGASLINTNSLTVRMGTGNRLENYGSINNSGTFTVGGGIATAILNHPAATLTNTSTFAVSGGLTGGMLNQGTIDNSGQFTVSGGVSGTLFINQETVTNRSGATLRIGNHDSLAFDNQKLVENEGNLNLGNGKDRAAINREGATIRNKAGGTLDVNATGKTMFRNGGLLENYHIVTFSGSPDTCFYNLPTGEVKNEATFGVGSNGGVNGAIINLGKFTHGSAGILALRGIGNIAFKNGGTFLSAAGCVINSVSMNDLLINLPNAVFENKCATTFGSSRNPIVNQGRYTHTAGSFTVGQMGDVLQNSDYAEINVPFTSTGSMGKFFVNSDTLILGPQTTVTTSPDTYSTHGTPLTNTSTGYVHSQADFTIRSATTLIDNAGKMVLGSQSTLIGTDMGTPIINTGDLTNEGTANFNRFGGYGINNSGTFTNKGRFETGNSDKSLYNNGGIIENSGVIEIDSVFRDAVLQEGNSSVFINTATGQINVDFVFGNGIKNTAGNFINRGQILIAQTDTVALSGINNAGMFQNTKLMRIGGVGKIKQHGVYNTGIFSNSSNSQVFLQSAEGSGITNQGGTITNQSCAYIESTSAILNAAGSFSNAGIIKKRNDNIAAVSTISDNSGKIINEDTDAFNVTGSNSGATISITSSSASMSLCANTRTLTATPSGGTFSVTGPGSVVGNVLTATGVGTIVVSYAYNNDPSCPYFANQTIEVISTETPTGLLTWTGLVDTDWNTACNWSPVSVPTATNDVIIPNTTNKPIINTAAVAQSVEVQTGAMLTIAATKSLTINGSRTVATFDAGFHNAGTVQNNGQLVLGSTGSVGAYGLFNRAIFNNNTDGEIKIDRSTDTGLLNDIGGTFTNAAKITIGAVASVGGSGLLNQATFNNNTGGEIKIDRSTQVGVLNNNNFNNAAKITIGATASVGDRGLVNDGGTFANTAGGDVSISRVTSPIEIGLFNTNGGTLTNVAKIKVDGATNGIHNFNSSFQNNANGEIKVDNASRGVFNESGSITNLAKLNIKVLNNGGTTDGLLNNSIFNNNADGVIEIDGAGGNYLRNQQGTFTNAAKIKLGSLAATEARKGIENNALFNNNLGGEITINNAKSGFVNAEGTFTNNALITITSSGEVDTHGLINRDLVTNNACGKIIVLKGMLVNRPGYTFTNLGLVQVVDNLENNGTFTNNGVLKYGSLMGTVSNTTNSSLIVNNTPTPIFTYGGTYNGVVNGIYTDEAATLPAGTFTAPNAFEPSGLPAGSQTLYAKITPQGGACSYVVSFTFNNTALAPVFTTQPTAITRCSGSSASFTAAATNATAYQWQFNSGGGWNNVPASAPYANGTTATLTISNVAGLNGYQFRCVAIGATVNTNSDPATLTVISKPTITLTTLQQTLNEGNSQTFCDTDANPVNGLQFTVSGSCVTGSPVWRVQVGSGAWSNWSATAPVSQPSNNQPHRYQAACDASCPSTYTSPIELTINYRASVPQNVSLLVDGVTVAVGETKEVCSLVNTNLTFTANCAAGEIILYSVDGGEYSTGVPVGLVDNQFHNYRVRCRKSDGTPSCVESESGVMRLKLVVIPAAPMVSLSSTSSCNPSASFSGQSTCGSLRTVWYNATTNIALPSLPATVPTETTSYYARCQTENGCVSEKSNVVTFTLTPTQVAPVITASQEIVCTGTTVTISANCPAGSQTFWNTGVTAPSFEVAFNNVTKQTYWAKCLFEGGCQSTESVRKDVYWNAFVVTLINIGESKSAVKPANDKSLWSSQFITRDGGPELEQSTQVNPTLFYVENANKMAPRYWTINVEACGLSTDGSLTFDMLATPEMGVIRSFNTHENNAPYFMYANREGWTELYGQNHPAYGFYQDNGVGGNVYDAGLPKGLYKLGIRYWDQKGWGSIYPSTRKPQGNVLAYQEYWFRIQSRDGVGVGAARTAEQVASGQMASGQGARGEGQEARGKGSDNGQPITDNGSFATVLPNPVSNILRLKVQDSKGQVVQTALTDASGREVLRRQFVPETNTHQEEFGVADLPNGVYFLKVNSGNQQVNLKVVKLN
ncbi:T9SS type A sorting domain-containing protein [Runella sp. SP2]|uniref:T9SS type A sorting domain-containing protein n=1 Tax=Runella sp. SP2 TaxID=2268026 RepID=UPI000F08251F|nr:T9SS type A sorting domain-containing protein [Runella sp. SP2]AYQ33213.1 T9SS C-terminal target domain-containing protein [Runella sp. SP2]